MTFTSMHRHILPILLLTMEAARGQQERPGASGAFPPRVEPARLLERFDADHDGRISREEAPERMLGRWESIDTNRDDFVTLAELQAREARNNRDAPGGGDTPPPARTEQARPGPAAARPAPAADTALQVVTIGTGSPKYDPQRSGPCAVVRHRDTTILVDMGNGTQARLAEAAIHPPQFTALLFTHHHLDHNEEFIPMFINTRLAGAKPLIAGPPGTKAHVDFILSAYAEDIAYRLGRRGMTMADIQPVEVREVAGGESLQIGGLTVKTARVNHTIHTIAYRFDCADGSIVISGDTAHSDALVDLARNADICVMDSGGLIVRNGGAAPGMSGPGERAGNRPGGRPEGARPGGAGPGGNRGGSAAHGTADEVTGMAAKAGVKKLVLTHIAPGEVDEEATIQAARPAFAGEVVVARDLDVYSVGGGGSTPAPAAAASSPARTGESPRLFVKAGAPREGADGSGWNRALPDVQSALAQAARSGGAEIWVAAGTYKPCGDGDRSMSFKLAPGVVLLGGFAGGEASVDQRDWTRNATTLSGDIGAPGVATDNSFTVVTGADDAVLDGFTICDGYALDAGGRPGEAGPGGAGRRPGAVGGAPIHITPQTVLAGPGRGSGAGMINYQCAPEIRNCTFARNQAGKGGAVYNMCATGFPPGPGTGGPAPSFVNCRFLDNHARGRGGAAANDLGTSPLFRGCEFLRNTCDGKGGAMYNDFACSPVLANCLFARNRAGGGGAVANDGGSCPLIVHCTFSENTADQEGAALYQGTGPANNPVVTGCILWNNHCSNGPAELYNWHDNLPVVTDSCVEGGWPGKGNLTADPSFVNAGADDFRPSPGSPCAAIGHTAATPEGMLAVKRDPPPRPATTAPRPPLPAGPKPVLRVDARSTAPRPDGSSWAAAFRNLSAALNATGGKPSEIWVAEGTYRPEDYAGRNSTFAPPRGTELYGGFTGGETRRDARDWKTAPTLLSGDIGRAGETGDNCHHVLTGEDEVVVDGFVIRDGNANGSGRDAKGGGMVNYRPGPQSGPMGAAAGVSPKVRNCSFIHNRAAEGGAVYNYDRSAPEFIDCAFTGNTADYGGAMVDRVGVRSTVKGCAFAENRAKWRGGAWLLDYGARPRVSATRFDRNESACHGGAVAMVSRASQLENTIALFTGCSFTGNRAARLGGAVAAADSAIAGFEASVFENNTAGSGGGALALEFRARLVTLDCRLAGNRSTSGDAETFCDATSRLSRERADWPEQGVPGAPPGPPAGFEGPRGPGPR